MSLLKRLKKACIENKLNDKFNYLMNIINEKESEFTSDEDFLKFYRHIVRCFEKSECKEWFITNINKINNTCEELLNNDYNEYDNISNDDILKNFLIEYVTGTYIDSYIPDYWLCYIVNGETEGLEENEINEINETMESIGKHTQFSPSGQCVTLDNASPQFVNYRGKGCECYNFIFF